MIVFEQIQKIFFKIQKNGKLGPKTETVIHFIINSTLQFITIRQLLAPGLRKRRLRATCAAAQCGACNEASCGSPQARGLQQRRSAGARCGSIELY